MGCTLSVLESPGLGVYESLCKQGSLYLRNALLELDGKTIARVRKLACCVPTWQRELIAEHGQAGLPHWP